MTKVAINGFGRIGRLVLVRRQTAVKHFSLEPGQIVEPQTARWMSSLDEFLVRNAMALIANSNERLHASGVTHPQGSASSTPLAAVLN